jgi:large subunit ribosomal protein L25
MPDVLKVQIRKEVGKAATKKVRKAGQVPAVLYGHGEQTVSLAVGQEELDALIRHHGRLVELTGDVADTALIREVQWDALGKDVLHCDLVRVSATESVTIRLTIELKGTAPGTREGGVVVLVAHDIEIECPVSAIPERVGVNINALQLGGAIKMADVELPAAAKLLSDPEQIVVHCQKPLELPEEGAAAAAGETAEPEIIGRKAEGEEEEEE